MTGTGREKRTRDERDGRGGGANGEEEKAIGVQVSSRLAFGIESDRRGPVVGSNYYCAVANPRSARRGPRKYRVNVEIYRRGGGNARLNYLRIARDVPERTQCVGLRFQRVAASAGDTLCLKGNGRSVVPCIHMYIYIYFFIVQLLRTTYQRL